MTGPTMTLMRFSSGNARTPTTGTTGAEMTICDECGCLIIDGQCWCDIKALIDEMDREVKKVNEKIEEVA